MKLLVSLGFLSVASASIWDYINDVRGLLVEDAPNTSQYNNKMEQQQMRRQLVTDNMCIRSLDDQGLNGLDQGTDGNDDSQADLSAICVGDNNGFISWAWDTVDLSGNNSQDACTYWRQPDGTVISLCFTTSRSSTSFTVFECGSFQESGNKCTGSPPTSTNYGAACTAPTPVNQYFATDPNQDKEVNCTLTVLPTGSGDISSLEFLNVCSKTSAAPASNSNDCAFATPGVSTKSVKLCPVLSALLGLTTTVCYRHPRQLLNRRQSLLPNRRPSPLLSPPRKKAARKLSASPAPMGSRQPRP